MSRQSSEASNAGSFAEMLVKAARQVVDDTPGERAATARRIHESFARRREVRKRHVKIIAAIIATLFGSTAFAWYAHVPLPWLPNRSEAVAPAAPPAHVRSASRPRAPVAEPVLAPAAPTPPAAQQLAVPADPAVAPAPPPEVAPRPLAPPAVMPPPVARPPVVAPPVTSPTPVTRAKPAARPPALAVTVTVPERAAAPEHRVRAPVVVAPPALDTATAEELSHYRVAHDAHFHGASPDVALAAWDAYLARYPDGQLAVEARYDRALILIRLERWADAEAALRPFASAPAGSYRQSEAQRLLDGIRSR